jgi:hypothetical protein
MGGVVSSIFGGGNKQQQQDNSAFEQAAQQIKMQEAENARMKAQVEEEKRLEAEKLAGRRSARLRGGSRQLLSEARLTPETGLQQTLGSTEMKS